ncbi:PAS domain S-box protein [Candidatus Fermentibacteria bacterium]|nr:PAS domain S-box protein [Candidatus Fermentibacteria bacterium]
MKSFGRADAGGGGAPAARRVDPLLREFVLSFADWIWQTDSSGRIVSCTEGVQRVTGYTPAEIEGRHILDLLAEQGDEETRRMIAGRMESHEPLRDIICWRPTSTGGRVCILTGGIPVTDESGVFLGYNGIDRDITGVMEMEKALRTQEAFVERLFDSAAEGIVLVDNSGMIRKVNKAFLDLFGWNEQDVLDRSIDDIVPGPGRLEEARRITEAVISGRRITIETERVRSDGAPLQVFLVAAPIDTGNGQIGFFGIYSDVTAWKRAQEELKEQTRFLSSLLENLPGMVYRCLNDEHRTVEFASRGCYGLTGYRPEELVRNAAVSYESIIIPEDRHLVRQAVESSMAGGGRFSIQYRIRRRSGEVRWVHEGGAGVFDSSGNLVALEGFITDIDDSVTSEEQLRRSRHRMEKLHEVAIALEACRTEIEACRLTVEAAEQIIGFAICSVDLVEGEFLVTMATSRGSADVNRPRTPVTEGLGGRSLATGRTICTGRLSEEPGANPVSDALMSAVSAPIGDMGVFQAVSHSADAFSDDEVNALELLLGHTAEALRRLRLEGKLRDLAVRDPLTGLYNRNYFNQFMEHESHRASRYGRRVGFLMIDLNDFKGINDRFGHTAGDKYLRDFADFLLSSVRKADIVVRFGGDEFLIVLPETDGEAVAVMERLERDKPGEITVSESGSVPVAFSIGCSYWKPDSGETVWQALERADSLMYEAKRAGGASVRAKGGEDEEENPGG